MRIVLRCFACLRGLVPNISRKVGIPSTYTCEFAGCKEYKKSRTAGDWIALLKGGRMFRYCYYCGVEMSNTKNASNKRSRDHILPVSRTGPRKDPTNVVIACRTCNYDKNNLTIEEYRVVLAFRRGLLNPSIAKGVKFWGEMHHDSLQASEQPVDVDDSTGEVVEDDQKINAD